MHMTHIHIFIYFSHLFRKVLDNKQVFYFRRGTSVNEVSCAYVIMLPVEVFLIAKQQG